jgi:hypothetical protein
MTRSGCHTSRPPWAAQVCGCAQTHLRRLKAAFEVWHPTAHTDVAKATKQLKSLMCLCTRHRGFVRRETGSIRTKAGSTHREPAALRRETAAQCGEAASPYGETASPYGEAAAPYGETAAPCREAAAPYGETAAPHGETAAPYRETAVQRGKAALCALKRGCDRSGAAMVREHPPRGCTARRGHRPISGARFERCLGAGARGSPLRRVALIVYEPLP